MRPDTLDILYEDKAIIVCVKSHGTPVQSKNPGCPDMESMLKTYIAQNTPGSRKPPYLAVIHRLDQPVRGILVFAKTQAAAKSLNKQLQNGGFGKYYAALVDGVPPADEGTLTNYIVKDGRTNTSRICDKSIFGAKSAALRYRTIHPGPPCQLEIQLETGRHHQIRVQLAHIGCPIQGDTKYNTSLSKNSRERQILKLCAYKLTFTHPATGREMSFEINAFPSAHPCGNKK